MCSLWDRLNGKTQKVSEKIVLLHSHSQHFFANISLKFSNSNNRWVTFMHVVILLSYMQLIKEYLLAIKQFDYSWSLGYKRPITCTGPRSAVGNVSGNRCQSDCRSRGREFNPGAVPYFRGDWSWNYFYGHSPPFRLIIQEGLLSVTSESMCTKYWLTACSSLPRKKCG